MDHAFKILNLINCIYLHQRTLLLQQGAYTVGFPPELIIWERVSH